MGARLSEEEVAWWEHDRAAVEQVVEQWYYEVSTPRFENDDELAELQTRILRLVAQARKEGAQGAWEKAIQEVKEYRAAHVSCHPIRARAAYDLIEVLASKQER